MYSLKIELFRFKCEKRVWEGQFIKKYVYFLLEQNFKNTDL